MTRPQKLTSNDEWEKFLSRFDVFLFDCDGVLWLGNELLPYARETLELLRKRGKRLVFVTNNSTKSRRAYKKKFDSLGIPAQINEIFGSAYSSAVYIKRVMKLPEDKRVYVLGESGVEEELESEGIKFFGGTDPADRREIEPRDYDEIKQDPSVGVVLSGLDTHLNYLKISRAMAYLQNPDTIFLATNMDSTYPTHGKLFPGAGTMSAPLICGSNREPLSLGKPSKAMMDCIAERFEFDRSRACMVGDRLDTDIQFGKNGNLGGTLLVLTGVNTESEILDPKANTVPDFYADKLGDLYTALNTKV